MVDNAISGFCLLANKYGQEIEEALYLALNMYSEKFPHGEGEIDRIFWNHIHL